MSSTGGSHRDKMIAISTMNLGELASRCYRQARDKGFWTTMYGSPVEQGPEALLEKLFLVMSELGEAGEQFRHGFKIAKIYWHTEEGVMDSNETGVEEKRTCKPDGVAVELADAIIRILDICGKYDIPINEAVAYKLIYNQGRDHRHGGMLA